MTNFYMYIFVALLIFILCSFILLSIRYKILIKMKRETDPQRKKKYKGLVSKMNHSEFIESATKNLMQEGLQRVFNNSKNPWKMTIPTFQFIRFGGLLVFTSLAFLSYVAISQNVALLFLGIGILCWYYPIYYYKGIAKERELEWNKMYEFVWIVKNNLMLYDSYKTYVNVKTYIEEHTPHNKELINGFKDFYEHYSEEEIDEHITKYYDFAIPKEIIQIIFNMNKSGVFPENELNALRTFIINKQDLAVETMLSGIAGKATLFSLPFMMVSVILALLVPLGIQILNLL